MGVSQFRKYLKVAVARKLISMGDAGGNLHRRIHIVFYAEGSSHPCFRFLNL